MTNSTLGVGMRFIRTLSVAKATLLAVALGLGACGGSASATVISGLYSSGVDNSGSLIATGATDTHWTVVLSPTWNSTANYYNGSALAYSINQWQTDSPNQTNPASQWITMPNGDATDFWAPIGTPVRGTPGWYQYESSFTLPANVASATITGKFVGDNAAVIKLNGVEASYGTVADGFLSFTMTSGFQTGTNLVDVFVHNDVFVQTGIPEDYPNPTGMQVQMTGEYTLASVPEIDPSAFGPAVSLLMGTLSLRECRRKKRALA